MLNLKRSHSVSFFCQSVGRNLKSFQAGSQSRWHSTVTVTFICHIISHFPTAISKTSIHRSHGLDGPSQKEKCLQLIPCACHPDYQQGDHEVEDDPVAADGSAGTGFCAAACNSTKSTEVWKMRIQSFTMVSVSRWATESKFSKNQALKRTNAASAKLRRGW